MKRLKTKLKSHSKLIENFSYLSLLQIFNMLLPLVTYPYLIRVLGSDLYGTVIFAQTVIAYFSIVINYGFEASATRDVSAHRNDKSKLSEIVSSAYTIKLVLWVVCLLMLVVLVFSVPFLREYKLLYIFAFTVTFNELLFPVWYFQGIEKMQYVTIINVIVRLIFLIAIFIFVKTKDDYLYVPLLSGVGAFVGGLISIYLIFVKDKIKFALQSRKINFYYLKDNLPIFFSNIIMSIKDRFNILLIGGMLSMHDVAVYDLGIKVMGVFMQPLSVANNSIYPKISREQNTRFVRKFMLYSLIFISIAIVAIQPFLQIILDFLSKGMEGTMTVTRILLLSPIFMSISLALSRNIILAQKKYKYIFSSSIFTTSFYLLAISVCYLLNWLDTVIIFAVITTCTYLFELIYRWYVCKRNNLL